MQITWSDFLNIICSIWQDKKKKYNTLISPVTASRILTKNYTHPFRDRPYKLNGLLQSFEVPKIRVFVLEKQNNKTQIQTKHKHKLLRRVVGHFQDLYNFSSFPFSTIIPGSKINTLPLWVHCAADHLCTSFKTEIYKPHSHNFSFIAFQNLHNDLPKSSHTKN